MNENKDRAGKVQVRVIEVVPYDPRWKDAYLEEAEIIKGILKDEIINTYHIGSTSIPGIGAKPVIDILVEVRDINNIDRYNEDMEKLGYIARGENGIEGRRFFIKGLYDRTHHVHIFQSKSPEITRHVNFRDYMIEHPKEAGEYSDLKKELAAKFKYDIEAYCSGKDAFIKEIDKRAEEWIKTK